MLAAALLVLAFFATGCESTPDVATCGPLPDKDACPTSQGGSCADVACAAIYRCNDGNWALVTRCERDLDAGMATVDASDAQACQSTVPSGPTCSSLEAPDCDAILVDQCPATACTTECTGFLRCTSAGWSPDYVAYCDDKGMLVKTGKLLLRGGRRGRRRQRSAHRAAARRVRRRRGRRGSGRARDRRRRGLAGNGRGRGGRRKRAAHRARRGGGRRGSRRRSGGRSRPRHDDRRSHGGRRRSRRRRLRFGRRRAVPSRLARATRATRRARATRTRDRIIHRLARVNDAAHCQNRPEP